MRRIELIHSANKIVHCLKESGIAVMLDDLRSQGNQLRVINALRNYSILASKFNPTERKIADIFGLSLLEDVKIWESFLSKERQTEYIHHIYRSVINTISFLPEMVNLLKQDDKNIFEQGKAKNLKNKELLTVIIHEEENRLSNPQRIITILESINQLYESCATIENLNFTDLTVLAIDSGSDKSFDLLGTEKLIKAIKEILISVWDRVVFYKETLFGKKIELIAQSLPVIEKIKELENNGSMSPEQAEILRRKIIDGVTKFLEAGAIIPEIEERSSYSPRQLLAPEQKLLSTSTTEPEKENLEKKEKRKKRKGNNEEI